MENDIFAGIRGCTLVKGLDDGDLALLSDAFHEKAMSEGTTVFIENMPGESLYLVKQGAVQISKMMAEGEEKTVIILGPEEVFGEMAIISGGHRTATARIAETARLLSMNKKDFESLCDRHPRLGIKLMRNIIGMFSERIRESEEDYREMLRWAMRHGKTGGPESEGNR